MISEKLLRSLDDYKLNMSFLEAELADFDFRKQEESCLNNVVDPAAGTRDHDMTDENLLQMSMRRGNSIRSNFASSVGNNKTMLSKSHDVSHL